MRSTWLNKGDSRGQTKTGVLITVLILLVCVYLGSQIIPFYYYYNELLGVMENQAKLASEHKDEQIRKFLLKKIAELELPINSEDDLKINRFNNKIIIDLHYQEVLYVDLTPLGFDKIYDLYVFDFNPHAEHTY